MTSEKEIPGQAGNDKNKLPLRGFGKAQAFVVFESEIQAVFIREKAHEIAFLVHHAIAGVFIGEFAHIFFGAVYPADAMGGHAVELHVGAVFALQAEFEHVELE